MALKLQHSNETGIKDRMIHRLPRFYWDSSVLASIYDTLTPELIKVVEYLETPDENGDFPDAQIAEEITAYLANEIGWGFERLINQYFVISTNQQFQEYRTVYDVQTDFPNYRALRSRLLFVSSPNITINISDLINNVESNGFGRLESISQDIPNYTVDVSITPLFSNSQEVITRRLNRILPAHLSVTVTYAFLRLSDSPQGKLSDVPQHTLA